MPSLGGLGTGDRSYSGRAIEVTAGDRGKLGFCGHTILTSTLGLLLVMTVNWVQSRQSTRNSRELVRFQHFS